eukprot:GHVT01081354.1.p1 GENE.GHVT01081354.1~~GHVT01081354.1.p1  ORF type:complete len:231 (-),score=29.03 GHVT01081354.1:280-972(-)
MVRHIHCNDVRLVAHDAQGPNVAEEVHAATEVRLPPLASFRPVAAGESHVSEKAVTLFRIFGGGGTAYSCTASAAGPPASSRPSNASTTVLVRILLLRLVLVLLVQVLLLVRPFGAGRRPRGAVGGGRAAECLALQAADGLTKWTTYRALGHTAGCPVEVLCSFLSLLLSRLFNSALLRRSNSVQIDLLPNGRRSYRIADPWARMRPTCRSCFSFVFPIYSLTREPEHGC